MLMAACLLGPAVSPGAVTNLPQITLLELNETSRSCIARLPSQSEFVHGDILVISKHGLGATGEVATVWRNSTEAPVAYIRFEEVDFQTAQVLWQTSRSLGVRKVSGRVILPETDRMHIVTAKPAIHVMGALVYIVLKIDGAEAEIPLSTSLKPSTVRFIEDEVYTFFVLERFVDGPVPRGFPHRFFLTRADLRGLTVYDRSVCEIHKVDMTMKRLPLASGLIWPGPGDSDDDTRAARFPNAREMILVGCGPTDIGFDYGYVCEKCREAESAWRHEHPQSRQNSNNTRTSGSSEPSQSSGR